MVTISKNLAFVTTEIQHESSSWRNKVYCIEHTEEIGISMKVKEKMLSGLPFNDIILRLLQSGIIKHWQSIIFDDREEKTTMSTTALSLHLLSSGFLIWVLGLTASSTFLILECYVYRKFKAMSSTDKFYLFWYKAHQFVDGERHFYLYKQNHEMNY